MNKIYCTNIKALLLERLKCSVYVHIVDEMLVVDIVHAGTRPFRYTKLDIYKAICGSVSSKEIATEILEKYKKFVFNEFFIKTS